MENSYIGYKEPATDKLWFYPLGDGKYELRIYGTSGWTVISSNSKNTNGVIVTDTPPDYDEKTIIPTAKDSKGMYWNTNYVVYIPADPNIDISGINNPSLHKLVQDGVTYLYLEPLLDGSFNLTGLEIILVKETISAPLPSFNSASQHDWKDLLLPYNSDPIIRCRIPEKLTTLDDMTLGLYTLKGIENWDTSKITSLRHTFSVQGGGTVKFNRDISNWDVSNITDFNFAFANNDTFNQPIGKWKVNPSANFFGMFRNSTKFNQPIGSWNLEIDNGQGGKVGMILYGATEFNQNLNSWHYTIANSGMISYAFMDSGIQLSNLPDCSDLVLPTNKINGLWDINGFDKAIIRFLDNSVKLSEVYDNLGPYSFTAFTRNGSTYTFGNDAYPTFTKPVEIISIPTGANITALAMQPYASGATEINIAFQLPTTITSLQSAFPGPNLVRITGIENWDISRVTTLSNAFNGCNALKYLDLNKWDTSNVTDLGSTFKYCSNLKVNLSDWDTSKVTNMGGTFQNCSKFNSDVSRWITSKVTDINALFNGCTVFNSDLSRWDVSKVTTLASTFSGCNNFNSDLSKWDVSKVTNMNDMFHYASKFTTNLSGWNVAAVTSHTGFSTDSSLTTAHLPAFAS